MRYIMTKDGIYEMQEKTGAVKKYMTLDVDYFRYNGGLYIAYDVAKKANTIKELCDVAVVVKGGTKYVCGMLNDNDEDDFYVLHDGDSTTFKAEECDEVYGAIWTDRGLIYVAKMNGKGELELL